MKIGQRNKINRVAKTATPTESAAMPAYMIGASLRRRAFTVNAIAATANNNDNNTKPTMSLSSEIGEAGQNPGGRGVFGISLKIDVT